jgi:pSer/pThr/pTyr-binding forkhead associated (FHA) protein
MSADNAEGIQPELTSTIHLNSLKAVPAEVDTSALLASLSAEVREIISGLAPKVGMLVVLAGPGVGARYLLDSDHTTVGRESANEIVLDDITVSRKHSIIKFSDEQYQIEDLRSLNGTYVNAKAVAASSLRTGDEIHVGKYRLTFFQGGK